jgi:STE24 endopeptidase
VFGYFSRLFERQADLTAIELGLPSDSMVKALDTVGVAAGNIHQHPSWHHYSIEQRINFLQAAAKDPSIIKKHEQKIRRSLLVFVLGLAVLGSILLSSYFPETPVFKQINDSFVSFNERITNLLTDGKRQEVAEKLSEQYQIPGSQKVIIEALNNGLHQNLGSNIPGLAEYYAAESLEAENQTEAAAHMINQAWSKIPKNAESQLFFPYFWHISYAIYYKLPEDSPLREAIMESLNRVKETNTDK